VGPSLPHQPVHGNGHTSLLPSQNSKGTVCDSPSRRKHLLCKTHARTRSRRSQPRCLGEHIPRPTNSLHNPLPNIKLLSCRIRTSPLSVSVRLTEGCSGSCLPQRGLGSRTNPAHHTRWLGPPPPQQRTHLDPRRIPLPHFTRCNCFPRPPRARTQGTTARVVVGHPVRLH
jgi:hypothetical protein